MGRSGDDPLQLPLARAARRVAISAGMQLDHGRAKPLRHVELALLGSMKSETRMPARDEPANDGRQMLLASRHIEATFGGHLVALLGHQAGGVRLVLSAIATISSVGRISKLSGRSISRDRAADVVVGDVAAVLARCALSVGARLRREPRRAHGIGMPPAPRIAEWWRRGRC